MSAYAFRMIGNNGLTTAVNATVGASSANTLLAGVNIIIGVGSAAPIYIRFGGQADSVTTSNGLLLPANALIRLQVPSGATYIHYIREASTDSKISLAWGDGGI